MPDFLADALSYPQNSVTRLAVETAFKMGIRPQTFMSNTAQPGEPWDKMDKKLLLAWTLLEQESCGECGQPLWVCRSDSNNLSFSVRTKTCYAKMAMDTWRDSTAGKKAMERPGVVPFVIPTRYDESIPLPTRTDWYKQLEEE